MENGDWRTARRGMPIANGAKSYELFRHPLGRPKERTTPRTRRLAQERRLTPRRTKCRHGRLGNGRQRRRNHAANHVELRSPGRPGRRYRSLTGGAPERGQTLAFLSGNAEHEPGRLGSRRCGFRGGSFGFGFIGRTTRGLRFRFFAARFLHGRGGATCLLGSRFAFAAGRRLAASAWRAFGIAGQRDAALGRPGETLLQRRAAATFPTLLRAHATASAEHARIRFGRRLARGGGERHAEHHARIERERHRRDKTSRDEGGEQKSAQGQHRYGFLIEPVERRPIESLVASHIMTS